MAEVIKSSKQIEDIFRMAVLKILKLNPESEENQDRILFPWGSNIDNYNNSFAPSLHKNKDTCVIYALPQDGLYNRQRDRKFIDDGHRDLIEVDEHTDIHYFNFVNYGPSAYEYARDIRDGLFRDDIRRYLKQNDFYLTPDVPAIKRVPELVNGEWWNRVDFSAVFNEYVRRENPMLSIEKVPLRVMAVDNMGKEIYQNTVIERTNSENG